MTTLKDLERAKKRENALQKAITKSTSIYSVEEAEKFYNLAKENADLETIQYFSTQLQNATKKAKLQKSLTKVKKEIQQLNVELKFC